MSLHADPTPRTIIMGVLNITPDSFSDGGKFFDNKLAVEQGLKLYEQGADIIDIGGESTRPGAPRVSPEEEQYRILPVVGALSRAGISVSVDTMNASTAILASEHGATYINDVSGGLADFFMAKAVVETGTTFIASHWRGHSVDMDNAALYKDAPSDIVRELAERAEALRAEGVAADKLILDPGLGFAKNEDHNWQMLGRLDELKALGYPLLIGASRKRFLAALLPEESSMEDRDNATVAVSVLAANAGVWGVRVHDVARTVSALRVVDSWHGGGKADPRHRARLGDGVIDRVIDSQRDAELSELEFDLDTELALASELKQEEITRLSMRAELRQEREAAIAALAAEATRERSTGVES